MPGMVRVVAREREHPASPLERLVPVDRRVAATDLQLAACIPDLDPDDAFARFPLIGPEPAPVRVGEIGDAAVRRDPVDHLGQRRELVLRDLRVGLDAEREHMCIVFRSTGGRIQLDRRDHEQLPRRTLHRAHPVVGDRQHVVAGPFVVPREQIRRQLAVRVGRVRVQCTAQPDAVALERGHRASLSLW